MDTARSSAAATSSAGTPASMAAPTATARMTAAPPTTGGVVPLPEGQVAAGRYRYLLYTPCEDTICPPGATAPPALTLELTVPAGWEAFPEFHLLVPEGTTTEDAAAGGGLVIGWTTFHVGLYSDPCSSDVNGHPITDIEVGPSVNDFVEAVVAHPTLDVSKPTDVELDGRSGKRFTLTAPSDISNCDDWRPWDPGFYAQGPGNIWDVWVIDVGYRILIVAQYFPDTPDRIKAELLEMVKSIEFVGIG